MIYKYRLIGEVVPKKNNRMLVKGSKKRSTIILPSARYREWYDGAFVQVMNSPKPPHAIIKPCDIAIKFYHGDYKRRDSDNQVSSVLDLLVGTAVIADDCWRIVRNITITNEKSKSAWCEVRIKSNDEEVW